MFVCLFAVFVFVFVILLSAFARIDNVQLKCRQQPAGVEAKQVSVCALISIIKVVKDISL